MGDNEIIKALECFAIDKDFDESQCVGCVFENSFCTANMSEDIAKYSLDLINRQKEELDKIKIAFKNFLETANRWRRKAERYESENAELQSELSKLRYTYDCELAYRKELHKQSKADVVKQFANILKSRKVSMFVNGDELVSTIPLTPEDVDEIAEGLVGDAY